MLIRYMKSACKVSVGMVRSLSNKTCIFTKPRRRYYLRLYPTTVVRPDGSAYSARYVEPRGVIKLPLDISTLTEEEKQKVLEERSSKKKVHYEEDEETVNISHDIYLKYIKK